MPLKRFQSLTTGAKLVSLTLLVLIIAILGVGAWFLNLLLVRSNEIEANCATYLSAVIKADVVTGLCEKGLVPTELADCKVPHTQLKNQDVELMVKTNVEVGVSSFEDVSLTFKGYITYCSDVATRKQNSDFRCIVDLSGVGPRVSIIFDNTTELITSVKVPSCSRS